MAVTFHLTDEDSDVEGYKRAKLSGRSDCCSLVRAATSTEDGPSSGVQATRTAGGTALAWMSDPLDGTDLTAAAWTLHLWAKESDAVANAALRFQVFKFDSEEAGSALLDDNQGAELGTGAKDVAITTEAASVTVLADGDRLVFKVLFDDATGEAMAAGQSCTLSYNGQVPRAEGDSYIVVPDSLALTAALPAATRTHVRRHLKDTATTNPLLADAEIDQAFAAALRTYSGDRPREVADYLSGNGSDWQFPLPRLWVWGFSRVLQIEYPTGEQPRQFLEAGDYEVRQGILGRQPLRTLGFLSTPESGTDNLLVYYTTRHEHTDELDTVPAEDFEAVTWLAASYAALTLSAKMSATSDPTIAADAVNYRDGQLRWKQVAEAFESKYQAHVNGVTTGASGSGAAGASGTPAGGFVDWDQDLSEGRGDRLFHSRRRR